MSDLCGEKGLAIGNSNFEAVVRTSVFVDKSMLIADILKSRAAVTLFCRPRRFGKSLNISMLQRFFEVPVGADAGADFAPLFGASPSGRPRMAASGSIRVPIRWCVSR